MSRQGTQGYISQFEQADPSVAVFYRDIFHTVAAFDAETPPTALWRDVDRQPGKGRRRLGRTPVMALGYRDLGVGQHRDAGGFSAGSDAQGRLTGMRTLDDLPELLLTHRIPEGRLAGASTGSFDHRSAIVGGPPGGYTGELVSSAGLAAVVDLEAELKALSGPPDRGTPCSKC